MRWWIQHCNQRIYFILLLYICYFPILSHILLYLWCINCCKSYVSVLHEFTIFIIYYSYFVTDSALLGAVLYFFIPEVLFYVILLRKPNNHSALLGISHPKIMHRWFLKYYFSKYVDIMDFLLLKYSIVKLQCLFSQIFTPFRLNKFTFCES